MLVIPFAAECYLDVLKRQAIDQPATIAEIMGVNDETQPPRMKILVNATFIGRNTGKILDAADVKP